MAEAETESDRISALPPEVKLMILSNLNIEESVRTSVLAHSWRRLWTFLPGLGIGPILEDPDDFILADSRWFELVQHLLSSLQPPVIFLSICNGFTRAESPRLQNILDLAYQRGGVESLSIHDIYGELKFRLPYFHQLQVLHLQTVNMSLPLGFQGFHNLAILELVLVCIPNDDLQLLIDSSKQLSSFTCHLATESHDAYSYSITIRSPNLIHLDFRIYKKIKSVKIVSAPQLSEVHITGDEYDDLPQDSAPATLELLSGLAMISYLDLTSDVLKTLIPVGVRGELPVTVNKLRCLELSMTTLAIDKETYDVFTCLLRSAPLLKALLIQSFDLHPCPTESNAILLNECMKKQDWSHCLNKSLTTVVVKMSKLDVVTSIWMIQFLLLNANALKCMTIAYYQGCEVEPNMIEELRKAKVTSSDAKLAFVFLQIP